MSGITITLARDWAIIPIVLIGSQISLMTIAKQVMAARKRHGVEYPAMYASVVKDKDGNLMSDAKSVEDARKFNSVQRGHQNGLEVHYSMMALTLVASIVYPKLSALALTSWTAGAYTYAVQYGRDGVTGRNKGVALAKYVGMLGLLVLNLMTSYTIFTA